VSANINQLMIVVGFYVLIFNICWNNVAFNGMSYESAVARYACNFTIFSLS